MIQSIVYSPHGVHGGDILRLAREQGIAPEKITDFSSNANSLCADITQDIMTRVTLGHERYPDTACTVLRAHTARHEHTNPEHILMGNGSSELIYLALHALKPRTVLIIAPIFSEYVRACEAHNLDYHLFTLPPEQQFDFTEADMELLYRVVDIHAPDMAILCTPNNPACTTYRHVDRLLAALRCRYILIDNSYREFLWGTQEYAWHSWDTYTQSAPPQTTVITLHSMTKFFYCTGIRLGYCHADAAAIAIMKRYQAPWSVWEIAQQAGITFLDAIDAYRERLPAMRQQRTAFAQALKTCGAFRPYAIFEGTNFVTGQLAPHLEGSQVYKTLLQQHLVVRLCDNIPGMPAGFIRMQVREESAWRRLVDAFTAMCP